MEEQYVSLETAKMLKEVGFDCKCNAYYHCKEDGRYKLYTGLDIYTNDNLAYNIVTNFQYEYLAPTQARAAKWLREVHNLHVYSTYEFSVQKWFYVIVDLADFDNYENIISDSEYSNYEEALEAGLREAIEIKKPFEWEE